MENEYTREELFHINFGLILEDVSEGTEHFHDEIMELIRAEAVHKDIEFDGYYTARWKESADTITNFDEDYFDDADMRDLYVYLAAMEDEEIFNYLNHYYRGIEQTTIDRHDLTKEILQKKIEYLTKEKGVRF